MEAPTYAEWFRWMAALGFIGALIPILGWLLTRVSRDVAAQQWIWRASFLVLVVLTMMEIGGGRRWLYGLARVEQPTTASWEVSTSSIAHEDPSKSAHTMAAQPVPQAAENLERKGWATRSWLPGGVIVAGMLWSVCFYLLRRLGLGLYIACRCWPCDDEMARRFDRSIARLRYRGQCRALFGSGRVGPFVGGFWRPFVVIPEQLRSDLDLEEWELVFAHEIAHLRNRDAIWQPMIRAVSVFYWWHPVVWWATRHLHVTGEFAADARAVEADYDPESLAACLVKFGRSLQRNRWSMAVWGSGRLGFQSELARRIKRLLIERAEARSTSILVKLGLSSVMMTAAFLLYFVSVPIVVPNLSAGPAVGEVLFQQFGNPKTGLVQKPKEVDSKALEVPEATTSEPSTREGTEIAIQSQPAIESSENNEVLPPEVNNSGEPEKEPAPELITRRYAVNFEQAARILRQSLGVAEGGNEADHNELLELLRNFMNVYGMTFPSPAELSFAGDSRALALIPDRTEVLVRATEAEHDVVTDVLAFLTAQPEQVFIEISIAELKRETFIALAESYPRIKVQGHGVNAEAADVYQTLSADAYSQLKKSLMVRGGPDILSPPNVTTLSGRKARLEATESRSVVFPTEYQEDGKGVPLVDLSKQKNGEQLVSGSGVIRQVKVGPVIEVIPVVDLRDQEIDLDVDFQYRRFVGYDDPGEFAVVVDGDSTGKNSNDTVQLPLPRFEQRSVQASATIRDGDTIMIRGATTEHVRKTKSKVPLLGDIPLVGSLFRREHTSSEKSEVIVFITATVIDPAGNRRFPPSED